MTPDEVVSVMVGGDDFNRRFEGICAYRLENNVVKKIDPAWWNGFARPRIEAVAASHTAAENNGTITNEAAYVLWQEQSLQALPSGAFIWKDEFENPYYRKYAWGNIIVLEALTEDAHQKSVTLKFDPFIPESAMQRMVMEGFENVMIDNLNTEQLKNSAAQALSQTSLPVATSINAPLATGDESYASDAIRWKCQARSRAKAIIAADKKLDIYQSQISIAEKIAIEFRQVSPQVLGIGGKPLTGAYIKRHALNGISSMQNKQLSTKTQRGI